MNPLVLSERALHYLLTCAIDPLWFDDPQQNSDMPALIVTKSSDAVCIYTLACSTTERLLVIGRDEHGLFSVVPVVERRSVFDRCARIALRAFDSSVTLNPRWMPFHEGNRVSIFAYGIGQNERILAEIGPLESQDVFVFDFGDHPSVQNLGSCVPDYQIYQKGVVLFKAVVGHDSRRSNRSVGDNFELRRIESTAITKGFSYADWYPRHLTKDQNRFVEHKLTGPIRLRGPAGTGKTLAMVLKALRTKYEADAAGESKKVLFVTHSWAMAEYVDRLIETMDVAKISASRIDVFPLLYIATKRDYSSIGREPLGVDSEEGKKLALREISSVVDEFIKGDWVAYRSGCDEKFQKQMAAEANSKERSLFCWDLLIEFGCVIAAQGILTHASDRERYLKIRRMRWMMPLTGSAEKQVVFSLWCGFMEHLKAQKWIASDQIVSDFLNDLSTYYWEAARTKDGYDVIFVDEMHLFNSQERLIFHNLLSNGDASPVVVMALDPKQSPRETFTQVAEEGEAQPTGIYERARLPNPEKIDLADVFRYTPEIARLIQIVHEAAPALDLSDDWSIPDGSTSNPAGPVPAYEIVATKKEIFKLSMELAKDLGREARKRDGRVAVLCMDSERLSEYVTAASAQYSKDVMVILSRDDTERLRYAGRRFLLSTPEYVAGLQFDTVIIVDANADHVPDGMYRAYKLRRFISELYLGFSRAEHRLIVLAAKDQGGLSKVLDGAVAAKALVPLR
jgi:hypothetical protein